MNGRVTLTVAATRLGLSYGQTLRLVMVRRLKGAQDPITGRWWVDEPDLVRLECQKSGREPGDRALVS